MLTNTACVIFYKFSKSYCTATELAVQSSTRWGTHSGKFLRGEKGLKGGKVGELEEDTGTAGVCDKRRGGRRSGRQAG